MSLVSFEVGLFVRPAEKYRKSVRFVWPVSTSAGKWYVCPGCVGRRDRPSTSRDVCVDTGYASTVGIWLPGATTPLRRNVCVASDAAKRRDTFIGGYKSRCEPMSARKDIFASCPRTAELRRAPPENSASRRFV